MYVLRIDRRAIDEPPTRESRLIELGADDAANLAALVWLMAQALVDSTPEQLAREMASREIHAPAIAAYPRS